MFSFKSVSLTGCRYNVNRQTKIEQQLQESVFDIAGVDVLQNGFTTMFPINQIVKQ